MGAAALAREPRGNAGVRLDRCFGALSDGTRRGVLRRLGEGEASIGELAGSFGMTLTGMKKHVTTLEGAGLVTTRKAGRVRLCRLGPGDLSEETAWIANYRAMLLGRLDRLEAFLEATEEDGG